MQRVVEVVVEVVLEEMEEVWVVVCMTGCLPLPPHSSSAQEAWPVAAPGELPI